MRVSSTYAESRVAKKAEINLLTEKSHRHGAGRVRSWLLLCEQKLRRLYSASRTRNICLRCFSHSYPHIYTRFTGTMLIRRVVFSFSASAESIAIVLNQRLIAEVADGRDIGTMDAPEVNTTALQTIHPRGFGHGVTRFRLCAEDSGADVLRVGRGDSPLIGPFLFAASDSDSVWQRHFIDRHRLH
jgi:hypothetical protein